MSDEDDQRFLAAWDKGVRDGTRKPRSLSLDEIEHMGELMLAFHGAQDRGDATGDRGPERKAQLRLAIRLVHEAPSLLAAARMHIARA